MSSNPLPSPSPSEPRHAVEGTRLSHALIAFYASCAAVSLGAGLLAMGFFIFADMRDNSMAVGMKIVGSVFLVLGIAGAFKFLRAARRSPNAHG